MTDTALMTVENESYVGRPIDRDLVVEFGDTLMGIHPNATEVGLQGMRTIAQLALVTGANPLPGTNGIHAWKDKNGKLCFKFGIGYWRTQAEREGGVLWVSKPRPMTESERDYYGIAKDQVASICTGALKKNAFGLMREAREFGFEMSLKEAKQEVGRTGVGIVNPNEYAKKGRPSQWSADKRAETDLLGQLVPAMSPALQNAQSGANVAGGLGWSAGEYAHLKSGEELQDDYGMDDANGDLFDDAPIEVDVETGEIVEEPKKRTFSDIVAGNGKDEELETEVEPEQAVAKKAPAPKKNGNGNGNGKTPTAPMLRELHALGTFIYKKEWDAARADISETFGKSSSKEWTLDEYFGIVRNLEELKERQIAEQEKAD